MCFSEKKCLLYTKVLFRVASSHPYFLLAPTSSYSFVINGFGKAPPPLFPFRVARGERWKEGNGERRIGEKHFGGG